MRKYVRLGGLLAGAALLSNPIVDACGSKFLVGSRAARYQRLQTATHPAHILWFFEQDAKTPEEDRWSPEFQAALEKVGHSVEVAMDLDALRAALKTRKFNIVVMDLGRARELRSDVASLSPDAALLPVAYLPTRPEYSQAKREFGQVWKTPSTMGHLLSVLDKAQKSPTT